MNDAPNSEAPTSTLALTPAERLQASRARLRRALIGPQDSERKRRAGAPGEASSLDLFGTVERFARVAWTHHPLRGAWRIFRQIVGPVAADELKPLVRSHPVRMVAIAAGLGAAFVWLRPWRLLPQAALLSMLIPRQAIWQAVVASGLDKLADGERLAQWAEQAMAGKDAQAPQSQPDAATADASPTPSEHGVLHRMQPGADGAAGA